MRRVIWACLLLPIFAQAAEPIVTDSTTNSTVHTTGEVTTNLKTKLKGDL